MMPTQLVNQDNHVNDVRVKTVYNGDVMITYINHNITFEEFTHEMVATCRFAPDQVFTMKWVDEEGDPCTISTQLELDESLRLYELNRDSELTVHGKCPADLSSFRRPSSRGGTRLISFSTLICEHVLRGRSSQLVTDYSSFGFY